MKKFITYPKSIAPLAIFRVLFGFIMLVSVIRFALKGWIYELYIKPDYFFTFYGFDWVVPLGDPGMYLLFGLMGLAATGIMLGYRYRLSAALFFLSFTYVELIDKTNYLNHYYFVSIISFLLMMVPANRAFSLDTVLGRVSGFSKVPAWTINIFKLQLGLVYFYAGLAKLNTDWLLEAMPLAIWLPARGHLPVIGPLLEYEATAYFFSWAGAFYDLTIVFFLLYKPTRIFAYAAVVGFHLMTAALFQIGMFPYIMILCTLIYFSPKFHQQLIEYARSIWNNFGLGDRFTGASKKGSFQLSRRASTLLSVVLGIFFLLQVLLPFRFTLYPGNLYWNEQGYRFSWRVMLMEKAGHATFKVHNPQTGRSWQVANWEHLTPTQEKMMATQPDMILQFAHHLEDMYRKEGIEGVVITADSRVTLNGRRSAPLVDSSVDLTQKERGFVHKSWILPYPENQKKWLGSND